MKNLRLIGLFVFLTSNPALSILGGRQADTALSSMSVDLHDANNDFSCSGTIIAKDVILTAAHCIHDNTERVTVSFNNFENSVVAHQFAKRVHFPKIGSAAAPAKSDSETSKDYKSAEDYYDNATAEDAAELDKYWDYFGFDEKSHEDFNNLFNTFTEMQTLTKLDLSGPANEGVTTEMYFNDVALIFLDQEIPENAKVAKLYSGEKIEFKQKVLGSGFGKSSRDFYTNKTNHKNLRYVEMEVYEIGLIDNQPAAFHAYSGHHSKNICRGDSGGGTWIKNNDGQYQLVGVASYDHNNCANYAGFVFINPQVEWINQQISNFRKTQTQK